MNRPASTSTANVLPFHDLSPGDLERLCLGLVLREGYLHVQHYGAGGSDKGWDVIGYLPKQADLELWVFQCKRYDRIGASDLEEEVDKCAASGTDEHGRSPSWLVFVTSCSVSAQARRRVAAYATTKGLRCDFWAETELDARVRRYPRLVWQFFRRPPEIVPGRPWNVPFPRNPGFAGREEMLANLHAALNPDAAESSADATLGPAFRVRSRALVSPVGLTGLAGIGKTQIAVEYAYRYVDVYEGGVLWLDGARPLEDGLAAVGRALLHESHDEPRSALVRLTWDYLRQHPDALVILDNLTNPTVLKTPMDGYGVFAGLPCRMLFTTWQRDLGPFRALEVAPLEEESALQLLLHRAERPEGLGKDHRDHVAAKTICQLLGGMPLALEISGSFLRAAGEVTLADFAERLRDEGRLPTVMEEGEALPPIDQPVIHAGLKTAFDAQYKILDDETAKHLLRAAGQVPGMDPILADRLGLLTGVSNLRPQGHPSPLASALQCLYDASLAREYEGDCVWMHPLVHEFAAHLTLPDERPDFCRRCVANLADAFEDLARLEEQCARRGIERLQEDLLVGLSLLSVPGHEDAELDRRLQSLLRVMSRECNTLQSWRPEEQPAALAQQLHYRATCLRLHDLAARAAARLNGMGEPWLALRWAAGRMLPALERTVAAHLGPVQAVAVLPGQWQAVSGADDGKLKLWNLGTGMPGPSLGDIGRPVTAMVAAREGGRVVAGDSAGALRVWDRSASGTDLMAGEQFGELSTRVWSLAITDDGRRAVSGDGNGQVKLWTLAGGPEQGGQARTLGEHGRRVQALALLDDGRCVASGAFDGTFKIWIEIEPDRWQEWSANRERSPVLAVAGLQDGSRLVVGIEDGTIEIWEIVATGLQVVARIQKHRGPVTALAVTPDGRRAISGSRDGSLRVWDLDAAGGTTDSLLAEQGGGILSIAVAADGLRAVSGHNDGMLRVWNLMSSEVSPPDMVGHSGWVSALTALGTAGEGAASGGGDGLVKLWHLPEGMGNEGEALTVSGPVSALAATPDGRCLAVGTEGGTLELWDLSARNHPVRVARGKAHGNAITALAVEEDRRIVSAGNDGLLRVWCLPGQGKAGLAGRVVDRIRPGITGLALVPGGRFAIAGADDGGVLAWELVADGEGQAITIGQHDRRVRAVAVSVDGQWAASGDEGGVIRLWNIAGLPERVQAAGMLTGHAGAVYALCAGHQTGELFSGGADGTLRLWVPGRRGASRMSRHEQLVAVSVEAPVWAVAAVPGGLVVAGDELGTVHCFEVFRPGDSPGRRTGDGT